ncbi:MAG: aminotransferase class I/II-fold pyridoxal phosphate-dependent enzyme, partial [archaeon]
MDKIIPARRTEKITYAIRDLVVVAKKIEKQGKKILYLNIGDPLKFDFHTPEHMFETIAKNNLKSQCYSDSLGTDEARQVLAKEAARKKIKNILPEDVLVFNGGSEALTQAITALVNPGENILTPCPGYPMFQALVEYSEGIQNPYQLDEENDWQPDLDDIRNNINEKTKGIIVINPNNPTGSVYNKKTLKELINIAAENNLLIFADETYDQLLFDKEEHIAMASLTDEIPIVTSGSLSKNYLCPGWRIGWLFFSGRKELIADYKEAISKLSRARLCPIHPQQFAIKAAFEGPQEHLKDTVKRMQERRDITFKRMNEIEGLSCVKPKGAF